MTRLTKKMSKFAADDAGGMSLLILPLFLLLMFITGLALDLIQHETYRADLQNAVDRGNLAAASLSQTEDKVSVVRDYVNKRTFTERGFNNVPLDLNIVPTEAGGYSAVTTTASFNMPTAFARMAFQNDFLVPAFSQAIEGEENIEISLVLDISGSMSRETAANTTEKRLDVLKAAAKDFVSDLLQGEDRQNVSISLVPYSGSTNAGPLFDELISGTKAHSDSHCIEFVDNDFTFTGLPPANSRAQVPQFQYFRFEKNYGHNAEWGWCPSDNSNATGVDDDLLGILPFSDSVVKLHQRIDAFHGHDGTGTQIGMKWGLALLDPTTQPVIARLAGDDGGNIVPAKFALRPAPFDDAGVQKIIVLMTDGRIRFQNRPLPEELETEEKRQKWSIPDILTYSSGFKIALNTMGLVWTNNGINNPQFTIMPDSVNQTADETNRAAQLQQLCTLAKNAGIRVFTIGFDITATPSAQTQMENCATTSSDYFNVEGTDLEAAFDQIASVVQALRLTQ